MKQKLTLLFLALLTTAGMWAQAISDPSDIDDDKCYSVTTVGRGAWTMATDGSALRSTSFISQSINPAENTDQQWAFITYEENTYLYNVGQKKFILKSDKEGAADATHGTPIEIYKYKETEMAGWGESANYSTWQEDGFVVCAIMGTDGSYPAYINFGSSYNTTIDAWGPGNTAYDSKCGTDAGNCLKIAEVANFDNTEALAALSEYFHPSYSITYSYRFSGDEVFSETLAATLDEAFPTPTYSAYGMTYSAPSGTFSDSDNGTTKNIDLTWNGFSYADSYANISQWYKVRMHSNQTHYMYNNAGSLTFSNAAGINDYLWGFVGDPINGFQVYSYTAGSSVAIDNANPCTLSAAGTSAAFKAYASSQSPSADYYFCLAASAGSYLNYNGGSIVRYSVNDAGSTFMLTEADVITNYYSYVESEVLPYFDASLDSYFALTTTANNSIKTTYASQLEAHDFNESEYNGIKSALAEGIKYPESGFYRLRNYRYSTSYMGIESNLAQFVSGESKPATVIKFTKHASSNTYTLQLQGKYVQTPTNGTQVAMGNDAIWFTPSVDAPGIFSMNAGGGEYGNLHNDGYNKIVGWKATGIANNNASYWYLENASSVSVALNSDGASNYYATLYLPFDAIISGADAFTLTKSKSGNYLVPTTVTDNEVPAGTPVLLKGTNPTATATINTGDAFSAIDPGSLTGTYVDMSVAKTEGVSNNYYLGLDGSTVGFYKWNGTTLKANRAYLDQSTAEAAVKGYILMFDDDATAIEMVNGESSMVNGQPIYNLAGQRISKMQKGINIVNGKKLMVK